MNHPTSGVSSSASGSCGSGFRPGVLTANLCGARLQPCRKVGRIGAALAAAEKLKFLSFRGALRAEESLFSCVETKERFLTSFGMTIQITFSAAYLAAGRTGGAS